MSWWDWYQVHRLFGGAQAVEALAPASIVDIGERINTRFSTTVFSGTPAEWIHYLRLSIGRRYEPEPRLSVLWSDQNAVLMFRADSPDAQGLSRLLNVGIRRVQARLTDQPHARSVFEQLIFGNESNGYTDIQVRVSRHLPAEATREVRMDPGLHAVSTTVVFRSELVRAALENVKDAGADSPDDERLGRCWRLIMRALAQLGYPSFPRDRFVEKIQLTTDVFLIAINVLYDGVENGRLQANRAGEAFEETVARERGVPRDALWTQDPFFRLLNELRFMLSESRYRGSEQVAQVLVREYLDERYLRLSLAGVMPPVAEDMQPMPYQWKRKGLRTPAPRVGQFGIHDQDDLDAWKKVEGLFRDMGCPLIRQLGIGEFGRVYEAVNRDNPSVPDHLAIKVDRIRKGHKKQAILEAEETVRIGQDLAASPHVIRVYDAGKLPGKRYTYHMLQCVEGETLDHLVGIAGSEHASVHRPSAARESRREATREVWDALKRSAGEAWRGARVRPGFTEALNLAQVLDLLTSILLWVEEIHLLGYAINDLKNGNLMVNRRGQLKGIDLDAYSPLRGPSDKLPDFVFLAVSLLLLLLHVPDPPAEALNTVGEQLMNKPDALKQALRDRWTYGDVERLSHGRVSTAAVIRLFSDLVLRSQNQTYAQDPAQFTADIDRLIFLKRSIFLEEIVLD